MDGVIVVIDGEIGVTDGRGRFLDVLNGGEYDAVTTGVVKCMLRIGDDGGVGRDRRNGRGDICGRFVGDNGGNVEPRVIYGVSPRGDRT